MHSEEQSDARATPLHDAPRGIGNKRQHSTHRLIVLAFRFRSAGAWAATQPVGAFRPFSFAAVLPFIAITFFAVAIAFFVGFFVFLVAAAAAGLFKRALLDWDAICETCVCDGCNALACYNIDWNTRPVFRCATLSVLMLMASSHDHRR